MMENSKPRTLLKKVLPFCLSFLFLVTPVSVKSASFNPTNGQELVEAIFNANLSLDPTNEINLIATNYVLPQALDPIEKNLTINGATSNPNDTEVSGNNLFRVFFNLSGDVTINNITIADGLTEPLSSGGGILNVFGNLTVNNCIIEDNMADATGGGIANQGSVMISDTIIRNNQALTSNGGGIANSGADSSMTITRSQIIGNTASFAGGGIWNLTSPMGMTIADSVIADNEAGRNGGGIMNSKSSMAIINSIIGGVDPEDGNTANSLGGIANIINATIRINTSTIANNIAMERGGGLTNGDGSFMDVLNSTISENVATMQRGGGIFNTNATLLINNVTVIENKAPNDEGGGIWNGFAGTVNSSNSIIAKNEAIVGPDCFGPLNTLGFNLIEQEEMCDRTGFNPNLESDKIGEDPLVGPLAENLPDNTPPETFITPTRALMEGSPAIDMGNPAEPESFMESCNETDQRRVSRPQGDQCDIGAFEVEEEQAPTPTPTPTPTPGGDGFAPGDANGDGNINILDVTVILNDILEISPASGNGDCNEDGAVNILDVTCVLNIILEG